VPESKWDATKGSFSEDAPDYFTQALARDAAEQAKRTLLPKTADEYQVALPKEFKAPEGIEYQFDDKNPALGQLKTIAHKHGLTQDAVSELLGVYAGAEVGGLAQVNTARTAELEKLGPAASTRIDNVQTWLRAVGGEDFAALANVLKLAPVAGTVVGLEKLMVKLGSQGVGTFSQQHRDAPAEAGKIPGYEKMSFEQRRHAQETLAAQRRH
jgi:hypothetical protein